MMHVELLYKTSRILANAGNDLGPVQRENV